ncbi:glycoside hydrolase family 15 protein [Amaricoccus solimangrovi]|uniref:Glycoside hydrolase family 15 protein n=1 Tax=Amaricoccus solimangrovi TaxID=2589815 RepID=A0A501WFI2_9RHOB|nr:glycoside hydrolase family 15 protein [Amaricoccus solimangrovi]TPE48319.1 glycoside hydrolase family 15 protein [Amaricoccus solimangrovi]
MADTRGAISDYGLIADGRSCALVSRSGSIDWLCWPRLDSPACFAALLGTRENGRWLIRPAGEHTSSRRYEPFTMILETTHETATGAVRVLDFMPMPNGTQAIVRRVEGLRGTVELEFDLAIRADYGRTVPWVDRHGDDWHAIAGPDLFILRSPVELHGEDLHTVGTFAVAEGECRDFVLTHGRSYGGAPAVVEAGEALDSTRSYWDAFTDRIMLPPKMRPTWREAVNRSLLTLKALTYIPSGGIAAAATTSLPETMGGVRNWDYRFCWLRDSAFTLQAFLETGLRREAEAWRDWLVRAVAGSPDQLQIMYGLAGERVLTEWEVDWLPGFAGSKPVRVGNAAADQFQLDVYGEVADVLALATRRGLPPHSRQGAYRDVVMGFLEKAWREPDEGIWEVRGARQHFVYSKVMAWVGFDHAAKAAQAHGDAAQAGHYRAIADEIHADVCAKGYNPEIGAFTQYYGSTTVDASLLTLPLVGFLPPKDPRIAGTVAAIERELSCNGFLLRYQTDGHDGLEGHEGVFLICTFWLVEVYALLDRMPEAEALFERLLAQANDLGLMSEEVDAETGEMLGNFPQAFSHIGLVMAAVALSRRRAGERPLLHQ